MIPVGSTFLIPTPPLFQTKHLYILIAAEKSTNRGLIVNFTTSRYGSDKSCVVIPGEHSFLNHESVINYADSQIVDISSLETALSKGIITSHDPVSPVLLKKSRIMV
ncbi:MAG: hypothetical protein QG657_1570 [Acidobacteriota bacterium]|nr:hypothetical protein [Acidobacteriota bacterium]